MGTPGNSFPTTPLIMIHVDVGASEGLGHLNESLEVAKALRRRGAHCVFLIPTGSPEAKSLVGRADFEAMQAPIRNWRSGETEAIRGLVNGLYNPYVLCNLLSVTPEYAFAMDQASVSWAVITELRSDERAKINFNIADAIQYMPLNGLYALAGQRITRSTIGRILINFGGSDPRNVTGLTIRMLRPAFESGYLPQSIELLVILGPLFEHKRAIQDLVDGYPVSIDIQGPLDSDGMLACAETSDIALTTAGGTMYEFCALGLPSVVIPIVEKHIYNASILEKLGAVVRIDMYDRFNENELTSAIRKLLPWAVRNHMAETGQTAIDGKGASRIADQLLRQWGGIGD